jgi:hypothetical protein
MSDHERYLAPDKIARLRRALERGDTAEQMLEILNGPWDDYIDELRRRYAEGDKGALFVALCRCTRSEVPPPPWVKRALGAASVATSCGDIRSWDEIFGELWPKGTNIARWQWKRDIAPAVWKRTRELIDAGRAIDDNLFDEVAELCTQRGYGTVGPGQANGTVGPRQVKELYYEVERGWSPELKATLLRDGTM